MSIFIVCTCIWVCAAWNARDLSSIPSSGSSLGEEIGYSLQYFWASLVAQMVKNLPAMKETGFNSWVGKIPWRENGNSLQYSCLENPRGQRSLAGNSRWGRKESDTTDYVYVTDHSKCMYLIKISLKICKDCLQINKENTTKLV